MNRILYSFVIKVYEPMPLSWELRQWLEINSQPYEGMVIVYTINKIPYQGRTPKIRVILHNLELKVINSYEEWSASDSTQCHLWNVPEIIRIHNPLIPTLPCIKAADLDTLHQYVQSNVQKIQKESNERAIKAHESLLAMGKNPGELVLPDPLVKSTEAWEPIPMLLCVTDVK